DTSGMTPPQAIGARHAHPRQFRQSQLQPSEYHASRRGGHVPYRARARRVAAAGSCARQRAVGESAHVTFGKVNTMSLMVEGVAIPDSKLAREITEVVRDTATPLLFHHSSRVYCFGALAGKHRGLRFDPELLYTGAMFHDMGLTHQHSSAHERFEVDGANAASDFLRRHGIAQQDIDIVWTAIALHTTPGIPQHMHPVIALVTAGVEMDVIGLTHAEYSDSEREAVVHAHPRTDH